MSVIEWTFALFRRAKAIQPERWEYNWQPEHFVPLGWASDVVHHARRRGLISSDVQAEACINVRPIDPYPLYPVSLATTHCKMHFTLEYLLHSVLFMYMCKQIA